MGTIVERNGRYLIRVRRKGLKPIAKTFTTKKDAQAFVRKTEVDIETGKYAAEATRAPSLREAVQDYRATVGPSLKGAETYRYRYDEFEALPFAYKQVNDVTSADLATWRDQQSARFKPGTVLRKLAMLSSIFSFCLKERGWVQVNPVAAIRKPRACDSRNRIMSDDEVAYLMAAAMTSKARWLAPALTVLLHGAMRRSELFGLKRSDVDYELAVARLHETKAGGGRNVPLCPRSLSALQELDSDAASAGEKALMPFGAVGSLSTRFKRTVKRARAMYETDCAAADSTPDEAVFANLRLHDLRHCAVTMWATTGLLSIPELQAVSGHRTMASLSRYISLSATSLAGKLAGIVV